MKAKQEAAQRLWRKLDSDQQEVRYKLQHNRREFKRLNKEQEVLKRQLAVASELKDALVKLYPTVEKKP